MFKKIIFLMIASCGLSACYVAANDKSGDLETLYGARFEAQLMVRVKSAGCTKAEHFDVKVEQRDENSVVHVTRTRPDRCRAMPKIIELQLPFPDGEKGPFRLENTFMTTPVS